MNALIAGLALAGGASSRFGADKAVALLRGRPLLAWTLAALDARCAPVAVSARPSGEAHALAARLDRETLPDDVAHIAGPLAGIAAGLLWARACGRSLLVTLPCDTPLVGSDEIDALLADLKGAPAAYAVSRDGAHGLCAVWRVELAETLGGQLAAGDHPAVKGWLAEIGAAAVRFENARTFRNINTPADLALVETALDEGL